MIVVADCSPLNYLVQISCDSLLPGLYGRVLLPEAVLAELRDRRSPAVVLSWAGQAHDWIDVCPSSAPREDPIVGLEPGNAMRFNWRWNGMQTCS